MTTRTKLACACYVTVAAGCVGLGLVYLLVGRPMPYHLRIAGEGGATLTPRVQLLLGALVQGAGGGALATGLALGVLALIPLRRGASWARWATPGVGLAGALPVLVIALRLERLTAAGTPWVPVALGVVLLLAGLVLCPPGRSPTV